MKPSNERQPRYGVRKFTVGVASVVIGSVLFLTPTVQATESLSHAPAVPVQVKDQSAGMEKEKPIQKKEDKVIPQGVQLPRSLKKTLPRRKQQKKRTRRFLQVYRIKREAKRIRRIRWKLHQLLKSLKQGSRSPFRRQEQKRR